MTTSTHDDEAPKPKAKSKPKPAPAPEPEEKLTPWQWALETGNYLRGRGGKGRKRVSPLHNGTAILHGWIQHEYDTNEAIRLTKEQYLGAIKALEKGYEPYWPAVSPYCKHFNK